MKSICSKVILSLITILFFACDTENESAIEPIDNSEVFDASNLKVLLTRGETNALIANGVNPFVEENVERKEVSIFGKIINGVSMGDYFFQEDNLTNMVKAYNKSDNLTARFASTNRIALPEVGKRTLRVGSVSDGIDAIPTNLTEPILSAIGQYNLLNMAKLNMQHVQITEAEANAGADENGPIDIILFLDSRGFFVGNFDGRAFFPDNGNPGFAIGFSASTNNFSVKNNTLLVLHEMGHTLGMAHSDFLTRATCGNTQALDPVLGDLLGISEVTGVCNIAGTDGSGNEFVSVMRSCGFFIWPVGTFTSKDKDAFRVLYSQVELPCETEDSEPLPNNCITNQAALDYIANNSSQEEIGKLFQFGFLCE